MPKAKAAVAKRSDPKQTLEREGSIMHAKYVEDLDGVVRAAAGFSKKTVAHLRRLPAEDQAAFIKGMIEEGDVLFQAWAMEILYVLGLLSRSRFTELQRLLGVSSRTLSDKLMELRRAGLVEREVFDEQPVRIEYFLTKRGQRTAVLGAALFADYECLERRKL
jgi:DNA-binding HxlR family transcriptional regulator